MKQRTWWAAAVAAVALTAITVPSMAQAQAQQGQQGQRRGGRGGRGGRGLLGLLSMPEVQKELSMQQAQIDLVQGLRQQGGQNRGNRQEFQSLTPEERAKRSAERRQEEEKHVAEILDAKQIKRLHELEIQQSGPRALDRKSVQDALKLSDDQRAKIQAVVTEERTSMQSLFQRGQNGVQPSQEERQQAFQKFQEARNAGNAKLLGVLTDAQKKQFQAMQGAPFTFPQRQFGRGRRGQPSTT